MSLQNASTMIVTPVAVASSRPKEPPQLHGLTGNDSGCVAVALAVGVHHPCHRLGVCPHVRTRDVSVDAENIRDVLSVSTSHSIELILAHLQWIALDAALRAAEGDIHECALPGHQLSECAYLVQIGGRVIASAAFVRTAGRRCAARDSR